MVIPDDSAKLRDDLRPKFPKVKKYNGKTPVKFLQQKLDGYAVIVWKWGGRVEVLTRTKGVDLWPKLKRNKHLQRIIESMPKDCTVVGELYAPGVQATSVPTMVNDADKRLRICAFAMPMLHGHDVAYMTIPEVLTCLEIFGFETPYTYEYPEAEVPNIGHLKALAMDNGWEGYVLKEEHCSGWWKVKPTNTVDCFVVATSQSMSPTHFGGLKALFVYVNNSDGSIRSLGQVGSGFEAEYRTSVDRASLIGRVCEVEYDSLAANGKLKFPRFLRWRDEKTKEECTVDQLEE